MDANTKLKKISKGAMEKSVLISTVNAMDRNRRKRAMEGQDKIRLKYGNLKLEEEVRKWRDRR